MKSIPVALQAHYEQDATTYCLITRIKAKDGTLYGFTDLDVDVVYNPATVDPGATGDDWGSLTHIANNGGFSAARYESSADLTVDNTELEITPDDSAITAQKLLAGLFDGAQCRVYRVNYADLSMGHELVMAGYLDSARVSQNRGYHAFRSLTDLLKEPEYTAWQKTCPHKFGGPKCPKAYVWTNGTVTASADSGSFTGDDGAADHTYKPGVVQFLTGANAGKEMDVRDNASGLVSLALNMPFPIAVGDTYKIREDCSKIYDDADHGCLHHWGAADRNLYFGGQPYIPTADGGKSMIPGARIKNAS